MTTYKQGYNKEKRYVKRHMKAKAYLDFVGADYDVFNDGQHIIINRAGSKYRIDFWPSTGRWRVFSTGHTSFGLKELAKVYAKMSLKMAEAQNDN